MALAQRFSGDLEKAVRRLECRAQKGHLCPPAEAFLCELSRCVGGIHNSAQLEEFFFRCRRAVHLQR